MLPWRERTIWRLVAADGNEICRASVASDGLVVKLLQLKDKTMSVIIGFVLERQPCLSE